MERKQEKKELKKDTKNKKIEDFPLLQTLLQKHTEKLRAIVFKERKENPEGVLQCIFTNDKKDNVKLTYVPKKTCNKVLPDSPLTKFINNYKHFETRFILSATEGGKSIAIEIPLLGKPRSNVSV